MASRQRIKNDQAMARLTGHSLSARTGGRRGRGALSGDIPLLMLKAPAPTFAGHQAAGKVPVGLSVLGGDGAQGARLGHFEPKVRLRVGRHDLGQDALGRLVLKDARVQAVGEPVCPGGQREPITGQAAVGPQLGALHDVPMPGAPGAIGPLQLQSGLFAAEGLERQVGRGADAVHLGPQGLAGMHGFGDAALLDHQGARGQGRFDLQQAGALGDVQGRLEARGQLLRQG